MNSGTFAVTPDEGTGVRRSLPSLPPPPQLASLPMRKLAAAPAPRALRGADAATREAEEFEWLARLSKAKRTLDDAEESEWRALHAQAEARTRLAEEREWARLVAKAQSRRHETACVEPRRRTERVVAWP